MKKINEWSKSSHLKILEHDLGNGRVGVLIIPRVNQASKPIKAFPAEGIKMAPVELPNKDIKWIIDSKYVKRKTDQ